MTQEDFKKSPLLGAVILQLLTVDITFKDLLKQSASSIAADVESASTNPNCSCRNKVATYVTLNADTVGTLLYQYAVDNNKLENITALFVTVQPISVQSAVGRVAKTSIKEWPEFAKTVNQSGLSFRHMSTSIVGDDVYVFFL